MKTTVHRSKKALKNDSRFMRVKEYADHIGISDRTLRDWIYSGVIPVIKVRDHLILIDPIKADAALQRLEKGEIKVK